MSRSKSPQYPNYSLRKAAEYAAKIFAEDRRNPIDRAVAVKHMGYTGLSGAADKAISTMMQYGLLEKTGKGEVRVSQIAVDILHPDKDIDRLKALVLAAFNPPLFKVLKARFPDDKFSNEALRSFLMREGFLERAISPVLSAYSDTTAFLAQEKAYESGGAPSLDDNNSHDDDDDGGNDTVYGSAAIGDLIQWEADGALQFDTPRRVRAVQAHEGEDWVFVEGSDTGIPMDEVIVEQKAPIVTARPRTLVLPVTVVDEPPAKGTRKEVFALDEGDVVLTFPENLSATSFEDLDAYLKVFIGKMRRRATTPAKEG